MPVQEAAATMLHETSTTGGSIIGPAGSGSASLRSSLATSLVAGTCLADDAAALVGIAVGLVAAHAEHVPIALVETLLRRLST